MKMLYKGFSDMFRKQALKNVRKSMDNVLKGKPNKAVLNMTAAWFFYCTGTYFHCLAGGFALTEDDNHRQNTANTDNVVAFNSDVINA